MADKTIRKFRTLNYEIVVATDRGVGARRRRDRLISSGVGFSIISAHGEGLTRFASAASSRAPYAAESRPSDVLMRANDACAERRIRADASMCSCSLNADGARLSSVGSFCCLLAIAGKRRSVQLFGPDLCAGSFGSEWFRLPLPVSVRRELLREEGALVILSAGICEHVTPRTLRTISDLHGSAAGTDDEQLALGLIEEARLSLSKDDCTAVVCRAAY